MTNLILASGSATRADMLKAVGIEIEAVSPNVDEEPIRDGLRDSGHNARSIADALAEAKALKLSSRRMGDLVIGADQTLECQDGEQLDKAANPDEAQTHLRKLSGSTHKLHSAAVVALDGEPIWRHIETVSLTVRNLSEAFIETYVDQHWQDIRHSVGCYRIEAEGAQLFTRIDGSHFAILGLPFLPLLGFLRDRGIAPS